MSESSPIKQLMSSLQVVRTRVLLAILFSVATFLLYALLDSHRSLQIIRFTGYHFVIIVLSAILWYIWKGRSNLFTLFPGGRSVWLCLLPCIAIPLWLTFLYVPAGFKIAMDDYILASTAENLHEHREVLTTTRVKTKGKHFERSDGYIDKRLWAYPVLVSLAHDIAGFDLKNSVRVNILLYTFFLLGLYIFANRLYGIGAAIVSVLLAATLPLLSINGLGGGMEMLNVLLLLGLVILAGEYLHNPSRSLEGALCMVAVLLAYVRYEALLFVVPVLIVIVLGWLRSGKVFLSTGSILSSFLLLPLLLQLKQYMGNEAGWELAGGAEQAFALSHVTENVPHALFFLFSTDGSLANSPILSLLGAVSLVALPLVIRREWAGKIRENPNLQAVLIFSLFILLHLLVVLGFHASKFDSPFVSRYSLPLHLLLIFATIIFMSYCLRWSRKLWYWAAGALFVSLIGFTIPSLAKSEYLERNFAIKEQQWLEQQSETVLSTGSLVLDTYTIPWTLRERVALPPSLAEPNLEMIFTKMEFGIYSAIYYVERLSYAGGGAFQPISPSLVELTRELDLELIEEKSFRPFTLTRLHRVKGFSPNSKRFQQLDSDE